MAGYPIYPLFKNSFDLTDFTAYDNGMNFFVFGGSDDPIFPPGINTDVAEITPIFERLRLDHEQVVRYWVSVQGGGHVAESRFFDVMMTYINTGRVTSIGDFQQREFTKVSDGGSGGEATKDGDSKETDGKDSDDKSDGTNTNGGEQAKMSDDICKQIRDELSKQMEHNVGGHEALLTDFIDVEAKISNSFGIDDKAGKEQPIVGRSRRRLATADENKPAEQPEKGEPWSEEKVMEEL